MRKQWYYNNGHQEIVTSVHSVKINTIFAKFLRFKPTSIGFSQNKCLISPFMAEFNKVRIFVRKKDLVGQTIFINREHKELALFH